MAYMSQEKKKQIAAELKQMLRGMGLKYTLGVHHHSTLCMRIKSGPFDFIGNYIETNRTKPQYARSIEPMLKERPTYLQINDYHYRDHFSGDVLNLLNLIMPILNKGNHDNSDIQTDYFDVGWYLSVSVGNWDRPYVLEVK